MNVLDLLESGLGPRDEARTPLAIDLMWNERGYRIDADLPGVRQEDLDIEVNARTLTIRARRHGLATDDAIWAVKERQVPHQVERELSFSEEIDPASVSATLEDGVLTLFLPLAPTAVKRRVPVKVGRDGEAARAPHAQATEIPSTPAAAEEAGKELAPTS